MQFHGDCKQGGGAELCVTQASLCSRVFMDVAQACCVQFFSPSTTPALLLDTRGCKQQS